MNIIIDHIPFSTPYNRRPNLTMVPDTITIHSTANEKSTAKNERSWLTDNPLNKRTASWHYVVDENHIIEAIPPNYVAWHATDGNGPGNMKSISIEMCESGNRQKVIERTKELTLYLMKKHNISIVKRHYDFYKPKLCPRILNADGKWTLWFEFLNDIYNPKGAGKVEQKLTEAQEKVRQEAIRLRITDGKDPHGEVNRMYMWSAMIPLARRVAELEKKLK